MKELTIGFSTCPNDTFIFDALVNGKIPDHGLKYTPYLADVEELNRLAMKGELDITKLSYHACGHVREQYRILDSGSALGFGNGPLLVSQRPLSSHEITTARIGIPGRLTTANLLLGIAYPDARDKREYLFSDIEEAILTGEIEAGVLIHETRFTYAEKGLHLVEDLGAFWERKTAMPIPLGGIVVRRDISGTIRQQVQESIRESLGFSLAHPRSPMDYMIRYAREMREDILSLHVQTFVNEFSMSLGPKGREAVSLLFRLGEDSGLFPAYSGDLFV